MVAEGWSGEVDLNGSSITGICCRGVLSTPITTTTTANRGELLYKADGLSYYKTPVPYGVTLVGEATASVCEKIGLKAACNMPSGHEYNSERCVATKLEGGGFGYIFSDLGKILCNDPGARKCSKLNYLFAYMKGHRSGECGIVDGVRCADGKDHTSTQEKPYYALCVQ